MQKLQSPWPPSSLLEEALARSPLSHVELAQQAGVNYHAVRRMRLDGVRNRSRNAIILCTFFGIVEPTARQGLSTGALTAAVQQAWDGTEDQGRLILELVRSVGQYKVAPKP